MMKIFQLATLALLAVLCLQTNYLFGQCDKQRPNIAEFSPDDQCRLRNLMLDYLSSEIDENHQSGTQRYPIAFIHHNPPVGSFSDFHNYAEEFATWHAAYIQTMEDFILSQGAPEFVPLPAWSPHQTIPDAFYNYNGCDGTYANLPENEGFQQYTNG